MSPGAFNADTSDSRLASTIPRPANEPVARPRERAQRPDAPLLHHHFVRPGRAAGHAPQRGRPSALARRLCGSEPPRAAWPLAAHARSQVQQRAPCSDLCRPRPARPIDALTPPRGAHTQPSHVEARPDQAPHAHSKTAPHARGCWQPLRDGRQRADGPPPYRSPPQYEHCHLRMDHRPSRAAAGPDTLAGVLHTKHMHGADRHRRQ